MKPKWVYRLEYKDQSNGLWYDGNGVWCFDTGIGSVDGCQTKTLPMAYDWRYKQDGRNWFSSCSNVEDLAHWYSEEDAKELLNKGFVFTRYLATEYHEYENETVFIKETALKREEIDFFKIQEMNIEEEHVSFERILCAAIWYDNGLEYEFQSFRYGVPSGFVLCGYRHPDIVDVLPTNPHFLEKCFLKKEQNAEQIQKYEELKYKYGWQEDGLTRCETVQGFLTSTGRFVNRKEAWKIALASGQIDENGGFEGELFSEDLY